MSHNEQNISADGSGPAAPTSRLRPDSVGSADLHLHTTHGDGMASVEQILDWAEAHTTLDVIAITDHDDITAAFEARELAARRRYRFEVVVGTEVTTREGHLLCLYLEEPVKSLQPVDRTLDAVHQQGGLAIVPHPLSWLTRSLGEGGMRQIQARQEHGLYFDGIETVSPTLAGRVTEKKARTLNKAVFHLPEIGASDAHFLPVLGKGYTRFAGRTAADLKAALLAGQTQAAHDPTRSMSQVPKRQIVGQQVRSLLWLPARHARKALARRRAAR